MTITEETPRTNFDLVVVDLYRDIHKGIRRELFGLTVEAGSLDPSERCARAALADRLRNTVTLLVSHAEHEDTAIQPTIETYHPQLAEKIERDHVALESRMVVLQDMADNAAKAVGDPGAPSHRLYLELASFTSAYLEHQDIEERIVMPALERAVGVEQVLAIHQAIVGNIPPDEFATALALALPAMNIDGRAEMLGGMRAEAPPEVFEGVWGLASSVLSEPDVVALAKRLGIG